MKRKYKKLKNFLIIIALTIGVIFVWSIPKNRNNLSFLQKKISLYDSQYLDLIEFTSFSYNDNKLTICMKSLDGKEHTLDNKYELKSGSSKVFSFNDINVKENQKCTELEFDKKYYELYIYNSKTSTKSKELTSNLQKDVDKCILESNFDYQNNNKIVLEINNLTDYLKKYSASVIYEDLSSDFNYSYNPDKIYYGASLIKLPEALYLYDESKKGNIDLDNSTLVLDSNYYHYGGTDIKSNGLNSNVSYANLIKYMLETSDNAAHLMLYDKVTKNYIGDYEKSLGATNTYNFSPDKFGYQTASSMIVYLKHAYEMIKEDDEYGKNLYKYMTNKNVNYLYLDDGIEVAHKYGQVSQNYHDTGIVFNDHPYVIAVLTNYNVSTGGNFVTGVHKKIKALHELYYSEKKDCCIEKTFSN